MTKTIFDHLKSITLKQNKWNDLSESDKKSWDDYMITRWLSMHPNYIVALNDIQIYRTSGLAQKHYYDLLYYLLPNEYVYFNYQKRPRSFENKKDVIKFFSNIFEISYTESLQMIELFHKLNMKDEVTAIFSKYGVQIDQQEKFITQIFNKD